MISFSNSHVLDLSAAIAPPKKVTAIKFLDHATETVQAVSQRLALKVEKMSPHHRNGLWRHTHMQETADSLKNEAFFKALSHVDKKLLTLIAYSHDIGRFIEQLRRFKNEDAEGKKIRVQNHGVYSAQILARILVGLDPAIAKIAIDAVRWHGEKDVALAPSKARDFCYFLRDGDKLEIWRQNELYSEKNIAIKGTKFTIDEVIAYLPLGTQAREVIQRNPMPFLLFTEGCLKNLYTWPQINASDERVGQSVNRLCSILNGTVDADSEGVRAILEKRAADASLCRDSYSNFLAMHLAMVFDVHSPRTFKTIVDENLFAFRLKFLQQRCQPSAFQGVVSAIEEHVGARLF